MVNLSAVSQLTPEKIKPLFNDLLDSISFYKEIYESVPASCRYLKTAYLLALENAFQVSHGIQDPDLREIIKTDGKTRHTEMDENTLFGLIYEKACEHGISPGLTGWVEKLESGRQNNSLLVCFLLDGSGFPLMYKSLGREKGEDLSGLTGLRIQGLEPEFFLAPACERLYSALCPEGLSGREKGYIFKEIFLFKQLNGWTGKTQLNLEKLLFYGPEPAIVDDRINRVLLAVTGLKSHLAYVGGRIGSVTRGCPMPAKDIVCTYFLTLFFKKMFDEITARHNIRH